MLLDVPLRRYEFYRCTHIDIKYVLCQRYSSKILLSSIYERLKMLAAHVAYKVTSTRSCTGIFRNFDGS